MTLTLTAVPESDPSAFDAALAFTIGYGVAGYGEEGGEANDPRDPGGFTWRGITLRAYRAWLNDDTVTPVDLLRITEGQIVAFYGCEYWNPITGDLLPPATALMTFDLAVNAGPYRAAVVLQAAVGVDQDGSIGPVTRNAANAAQPTFLLGRLAALRKAFYASLSTYSVFGQGWDGRTDRCEAAASALLASHTNTVVNFGDWLRRAGEPRVRAVRVPPRLAA